MEPCFKQKNRQSYQNKCVDFFYYEILVNRICKMKMNFRFRVRADESPYAFILLTKGDYHEKELLA